MYVCNAALYIYSLYLLYGIISVNVCYLLTILEFYLDRSPQCKHMAGPFFSEGSFTKNSEQDVDQMMENLEKWSSAKSRIQ